MRAAHVQPRQPRHRRLEDGVDDRRASGLALVGDGGQQDAAGGEVPAQARRLVGEAVLAVADAIPVGDVGQEHRTLDDPPVADLVLHVDVLGPVDAGDDADLGRRQPPDLDHCAHATALQLADRDAPAPSLLEERTGSGGGSNSRASTGRCLDCSIARAR